MSNPAFFYNNVCSALNEAEGKHISKSPILVHSQLEAAKIKIILPAESPPISKQEGLTLLVKKFCHESRDMDIAHCSLETDDKEVSERVQRSLRSPRGTRF